MRNADSSASYSYDRSLFKRFMVTLDYRSN